MTPADTELISAPAYWHAARHAPNINSFGSAIAIIQDELGHAHIAYRLLRDLGVDTEELVYQRDPVKWKYPYAFDVPLDSFYELIIANAFYDRAGYTLLGDVAANTTFGPWKRALVKVDKEETFHLRHGEQWMRKLAPLCQELGFRVPAHHDEASQRWVVDCAFPSAFDERRKRWLLEEGAITWDDVMVRWKKRGPSNAEFVAHVQRGNRGLAKLLEVA